MRKMIYTGLDLFMENLTQMITWNDNPLFHNRPLCFDERDQIRRLLVHINRVNRTLFVEKENDLHELKQVRILKTRFTHAVEEARAIVGLFVYGINFRRKNPLDIYHIGRFMKEVYYLMHRSNYDYLISLIDHPLYLENVINLIISCGVEFNHINAVIITQKMNSSPSVNCQKMQPSSGTSFTRNSLRTEKLTEEMIVGLDHDAELIRDQLVQDQKQLHVTSIVGMGGIGKTTLATKVFNDCFVVYHFHVRAWVTVSQKYEKQDLLIQILAFMGSQLELEKSSYLKLREELHKILMGKRYLIVVDDIWSIEAWNDLKVIFPNNHTGSRILLTSRLKEVASYATSNGYIHELTILTDEESWELLRKKVFNGSKCPNSLIEPGMQIARKCHGLPLAVVVIAGVLAKEAVSIDSWERIAQTVTSYIVRNQNGHVDILALSYDHLPPHLKVCFLYLGGFPEDFKFRASTLIWLWISEGFIQTCAYKSLEEIGENYLMELVDRNLVVIEDRKFNGSIKACSVHDLLRELCLVKATQEHFCLKINTPLTSFPFMRPRYMPSSHVMGPRRIFTNVDFLTNNFSKNFSSSVESLLCFHRGKSLINIPDMCFYSYPLLMVLDLQKCRLEVFPQAIELLVHLRYLAFWFTNGFPSSICNLWSLQTIIAKSFMPLILPKTISNLVKLRHLKSDRDIYFESVEKPMNLKTISKVSVNGDESWVKYIPVIKKLTSSTRAGDNHNFESLTSLETLTWITVCSYRQAYGQLEYPKIHMRLPASLKNLSLAGCFLPWSDISIIQSLPNLQVLKILKKAFVGPRWETSEEQFRKLQFLKLQGLNIQQWIASSKSFPFLKRLVLAECEDLEEIPLELGNIPTLELIEVDQSSSSVIESLDGIREEQDYLGNCDLKINIGNKLHNRNTWKLAGIN